MELIHDKFNVNLLNGFVNLNTLSLDGRFYYKIRKPEEISMGVYASDLAFFDKENNLIFCTEKYKPASVLPPFDSFNNVEWIKGDYVIFIEYNRGKSKLCCLSLLSKKCFKYDVIDNEELFQILNYMKNYGTIITEALLVDLGFEEFYFNENYLAENFQKSIFNKWYPR